MKFSPGQKLLLHMILIMVSLLTITPYLWALSTSLKVRTDVFTPVPQWIPSRIVTTNYKEVFSMAPFGRYLVNTIIVSQGAPGSGTAHHVFGVRVRQDELPGSRFFFALYLIQMMLPVHAIIVPNYLTIRRLGLLDTRLAMMLPFFASGYGTFLVRQAFKQVPRSLRSRHRRRLPSLAVPLADPRAPG